MISMSLRKIVTVFPDNSLFNCTTIDVQCNDTHRCNRACDSFLLNWRLENYWLAFMLLFMLLFHTIPTLKCFLSHSYSWIVFVLTFPCLCWMKTSKRQFFFVWIQNCKIAELFNRQYLHKFYALTMSQKNVFLVNNLGK